MAAAWMADPDFASSPACVFVVVVVVLPFCVVLGSQLGLAGVGGSGLDG